MLRTVQHRVAVVVGKTARVATRVRGGGSAAPGLVVERIDPRFLAHSLAGLPDGVVVVTGTNGKTTTTKMLAAIMQAHGKRVFSNPTGSNYPRGVISAMLGDLPLSGRVDADVAVLELDERKALLFAEVIQPTHALLLNVARDQLDRFAEIDITAQLLASLATQTTTGVVLNRDDSFVARIREQIGERVDVAWFGVDPQVVDLLSLHETDVRFVDEIEVPAAGDHDGLLHPVDGSSLRVDLGSQRVGPLELRQRGLAAMINATAATTMARQVLGEAFSTEATARALREVMPPFGRGEVIDADGHPLELVLVKNPAGFTMALSTYGTAPATTMIAVNDDYADGQDVSWLYDVSFESLRHKGVALTSGVRAYDMALRLDYDDVGVGAIEPDLEGALGRFLGEHPQEPRRIFCTYTAMMLLRRMLATRYGLANFGEEQT